MTGSAYQTEAEKAVDALRGLRIWAERLPKKQMELDEYPARPTRPLEGSNLHFLRERCKLVNHPV
jgi:hypothetical protein